MKNSIRNCLISLVSLCICSVSFAAPSQKDGCFGVLSKGTPKLMKSLQELKVNAKLASSGTGNCESFLREVSCSHRTLMASYFQDAIDRVKSSAGASTPMSEEDIKKFSERVFGSEGKSQLGQVNRTLGIQKEYSKNAYKASTEKFLQDDAHDKGIAFLEEYTLNDGLYCNKEVARDYLLLDGNKGLQKKYCKKVSEEFLNKLAANEKGLKKTNTNCSQEAISLVNGFSELPTRDDYLKCRKHKDNALCDQIALHGLCNKGILMDTKNGQSVSIGKRTLKVGKQLANGLNGRVNFMEENAKKSNWLLKTFGDLQTGGFKDGNASTSTRKANHEWMQYKFLERYGFPQTETLRIRDSEGKSYLMKEKIQGQTLEALCEGDSQISEAQLSALKEISKLMMKKGILPADAGDVNWMWSEDKKKFIFIDPGFDHATTEELLKSHGNAKEFSKGYQDRVKSTLRLLLSTCFRHNKISDDETKLGEYFGLDTEFAEEAAQALRDKAQAALDTYREIEKTACLKDPTNQSETSSPDNAGGETHEATPAK